MNEKVLAWHFTNGKKLRDGKRLVVGKTYRLPKYKKPVMCSVGYHASERLIDALGYAPGSTLSRVELSGAILRDDDKLCASERKVLWTVDVDRILYEAACVFATRALMRERKAGREPDKRSWAAIKVKRAWLKGEATDAELAAAWAAARAAALDAAWDAAGAAERDWQEWYLVRVANKARKEQEV